tara:strand:- start:123 stop:1055 length:933 start_codon:yes stop_codon:yes gene_type:complete
MIILKNLKLILIVIVILFNYKSSLAVENKIIIKVNNEIITSIDISKEVNYLKIFNPSIEKLEKEKVFSISKNSLIRDKIKQITLLKFIDKIYLEEKYLNELISSLYKRKNLNNLDEYKLFLKKNNLDLDYIKKKITIERLWNEMIFQKFNNKVKINKEQIKNEILKNPDEELLLSEILISKLKKDLLIKKYQKIEIDIQKDGFKNAALIHSISDSSKNGGTIGWINKNSLNKSILKELSKIKIGEYTRPILTPSGYLILKIENVKKNQTNATDLDNKINRAIRLKTNQQLNQYSNIYLNKLMKDMVINEL